MTFPSLSFFISKMELIHPRPPGFCESFKEVACTRYLVEQLESAKSSVNVMAPAPTHGPNFRLWLLPHPLKVPIAHK